MSIRRRLLFGHAAAMTVVMGGLGLGLCLLVGWELRNDLDARCRDLVDRLAGHLSSTPDGLQLSMSRHDVEPGVLWQVRQVDGRLVAGSADGHESELFERPATVRTTFWETDHEQGMVRVAAARVRVTGRPERIGLPGPEPGGSGPERLADIWVAEPMDRLRHHVVHLAWLVVFGVPVGVVCSTLIGYLVIGRSLAPVGRMARAAEAITARRLDHRLPIDDPADELGRLATVVNAMLDRLEEGFRRERDFTHGASHELRTPLTAMRSALEVTLRRERDAAAYREVLVELQEPVERLQRLIDSLLVLAREDRSETEAAEIDLRDLLEAVVDRAVERAPDGARFQVDCTATSLPVRGRADLLDVLIANLVQNALHHGQPPLAITCRRQGDQACLVVSNAVDDLPAEQLPRLFEPFYRLDGTRSRASGGVGLGLAICRRIVTHHGGDLTVTTSGGVIRFTVLLPLAGTR